MKKYFKTIKPSKSKSIDNLSFHPSICMEYQIQSPELEFKFHPIRKWRWDFCWPGIKLAVEINGGIFRKGGGAHQGKGHLRDMEKINAGIELGWVTLQYIPGKVDYKQVVNVIKLLNDSKYGKQPGGKP